MSVSTAYLEFRRQLNQMQSTARVSNLVSGAVSRARNLPESAEVHLPALLVRVAHHKGINVNADEVSIAARLVARQLQLEHR